MIGFGPSLDGRLLDLNEIADARALAEAGAWPKPRKWSNRSAFAHPSARKMGKRADNGAVFHGDLLAEHDVRLDDDVLSEFGVRRQKHRIRRDQRHAGSERRGAQPLLSNGFSFGKLVLGIDAAHFVLLDFDGDRAELHGARDLDRIGQIKFALAIFVANPPKDSQRMFSGECHDAGIAETARALLLAGIGFFTNGNKLSFLDNEPAVTRRIRRPKARNRDGRASGNGRAQSLRRRARWRPSRRAPRVPCLLVNAAQNTRRLAARAWLRPSPLRGAGRRQLQLPSLAPRIRRRAHEQAASARRPRAVLWAEPSACACPPRLQARWRGRFALP